MRMPAGSPPGLRRRPARVVRPAMGTRWPTPSSHAKLPDGLGCTRSIRDTRSRRRARHRPPANGPVHRRAGCVLRRRIALRARRADAVARRRCGKERKPSVRATRARRQSAAARTQLDTESHIERGGASCCGMATRSRPHRTSPGRYSDCVGAPGRCGSCWRSRPAACRTSRSKQAMSSTGLAFSPDGASVLAREIATARNARGTSAPATVARCPARPPSPAGDRHHRRRQRARA